MLSELILLFFHGEFTSQVSLTLQRVWEFSKGSCDLALGDDPLLRPFERRQGFKRCSGMWKGPFTDSVDFPKSCVLLL